MSLQIRHHTHFTTCVDYRRMRASMLSISNTFVAIKKVEVSGELIFEHLKEDSSPAHRSITTMPSLKRVHFTTRSLENSFELFIQNIIDKEQQQTGMKLTHKKLLTNIHHITPSPINISFKRKVISFIENKGISTMPVNVIDAMIKVYALALDIHIDYPENLLFISSKSPVFEAINKSIVEKNMSLAESNYKLARLSVRMFPSGICSLTIPNTQVFEGSCKTIKRELVIHPDLTLELKRRCKLKKNKSDRHIHNFNITLNKTAQLQLKRIISPEVIFKKNDNMLTQFLVEDCEMDLFELFCNMPTMSSSERMFAIFNTPIEQQAHQVLNLMIETTLGIRDLHHAGYLHNDIKPENILIKIEGAKYRAKIADLDFMCDIKEGASLTVFRGTRKYCKTESYAKSIDTDLYALAKTFFFGEHLEDNLPSFFMAFMILRQKAKAIGDIQCDGKIKKIIEVIKKLSSDIESSCDEKDPNKKLGIDTILLMLSHLRADCFSNTSNTRALALSPAKKKVKTHARFNSF